MQKIIGLDAAGFVNKVQYLSLSRSGGRWRCPWIVQWWTKHV